MKLNYVITGTSRGIGLELTKQVLEKGHCVFALARGLDRDPKKSSPLMALKEKYPDQLHITSGDVTSDDQVLAFAKSVPGSVDVLINNAGIYGESADFEKLSLKEVERVFSNNTVAPMRVTRAFLPHLKRSKNPKTIHITSLMGSIEDNSSGGSYGYRISKTALNMFHKCFSIDYPQITSLVIHPGWVKTDMGGKSAPTEPQESAKGILSIIDKASLKMTGRFFDFEGDELPW